jgi:hypothetical protein
MRYFDDFDSKFGFSGGDDIPEDAWAVRTAGTYIFNRTAERAGVPTRLIPLDRPGAHNWLLLRISKLDICRLEIDTLGHRAFAMGPFRGKWRQPNTHWIEPEDDVSRLGSCLFECLFTTFGVDDLAERGSTKRGNVRWKFLDSFFTHHADKAIDLAREITEERNLAHYAFIRPANINLAYNRYVLNL